MPKLNHLRPKAIQLRQEGNSYGYIMRTLGLKSKGTLSYWFKKLQLSEYATKKLENNTRLATERGILSFNVKRTERIKKENEGLRSLYSKMVGRISNRELMLLGAAIYWGEGQKRFNDHGGKYPYICFANSDPYMVSIFLKFIKKILKISSDNMYAVAMIYPGCSSDDAVKYWHDLTKIPLEKFHFYVALSRASQGKRPKNLLPYGTFQLRVHSRQEFFKIRGLIDGIIKNT